MSKRSKSAYQLVGVETYGGGIWHSWLDRDLSIAGRVVIAENGGSFTSKLIKVDRPILRIPSLAIHCKSGAFILDHWSNMKLVDRGVNDNFKFNQETEFIPILGMIESQLNASTSDKDEETRKVPKIASSIQEYHHPALLELLASELSVVPEEIHDFELYVARYQYKSVI